VSPALSRIRVAKLEEIGIDMAVTCLGCAEHPCLEACPTEALSIDSSGVVRLDHELCSLCDECQDACPIGAVGLTGNEPLFCNLCDGETACVASCPTGALSYQSAAGISLKQFSGGAGKPSQRRAQFAKKLSQALREKWQSGGRVDS
jgi:Fe-S-cluster-containing hydrogenase component 2